MQLAKLFKGLRAAYSGSNVASRMRHFDGWTDRATSDEVGVNAYDHVETVREYYDLCSEFMVFGWSEALHFSPLAPGESLEESQIRHQRMMIGKLQLQEGMTIIDVGCGVGGPMRRVVQEAGVRVVGVNSSEVQLEMANSLNAEAGVERMADCIACSFMDMSGIEDGTFDRGYAIESTCHAPNKEGAFAEIFRVLRPGALFWGQEMCLTDKFDPDDVRHQTVKQHLQHGVALNEIATMDEVNRALEKAGFVVEEVKDLAVEEGDSVIPWYRPMERRHGNMGAALSRIPLGRKALIGASRLAEALGAIPKGSADVVRFMDRTADAYVAGGRTGIFTPLYCFLARKPS
ncbi:MAG: methyltransferase domain-containing protein [Boseongicola sp. SB0675_bin_26]|nr:methyltransferase domain-containing protein [Boseongicola sp. SB0675_bin_26]